MMKTFSLRVEKELPEASFTVTMSKAPGWVSTCKMVPTRPVLRPLVIIASLPISNFKMSNTLPVAISTYRIVGRAIRCM